MDEKYGEEQEAKPSSQQDVDSATPTVNVEPGDELECLRRSDKSASQGTCCVSVDGVDTAGELMPPEELSPVIGEGDGTKDSVRGECGCVAEASELLRDGNEGSVDRYTGSVAEPSESHRDGGDDSIPEERNSMANPSGLHLYGGKDSFSGGRDCVAESSESSRDGEKSGPIQQSFSAEGDIIINNEDTTLLEPSFCGDNGDRDGVGEEKIREIADVVKLEEKIDSVDGQKNTADGEDQKVTEEADVVAITDEVKESEDIKPPGNDSLADLLDDREIPDDNMLAEVAGFTEILPQDKEVPETSLETIETQKEDEGPSQEVLVVGYEGDKDVMDGVKRKKEDVKDGVYYGSNMLEQNVKVFKQADGAERMEEANKETENMPDKKVMDDTVEEKFVSEDKVSVEIAEKMEAPEVNSSVEITEKIENPLEEKMVSSLAGEEESQPESQMSDANEAETERVEEMKAIEGAEEAKLKAEDEPKMKEKNEIGDVEMEDLGEETVKAEEMPVTEITEEETKVKDESQLEEDSDMVDGTIGMTTLQDSPVSAANTQEETDMADVGEEERQEVVEAEEESRGVGGKRKRGKNSKTVKGSGKKAEEDVCFICFDGGDLVLCDRRGCPKAYHPSCVGRDEAFFQSKGKWNCGWHLCSKCGKTAFYMCYTCTTSLCKGCSKDAAIFCIRGNKGLCETCMDTVKLIESSQQENKETAQLDFDDKSSWEYLFKDYWTDLKNRLGITAEELAQAKSPRRGHNSHSNKLESSIECNDANDGGRSESGSPSKKRKSRRQSKSGPASAKSPSTGENVEWASGELLEVVGHMKNGDRSFLPRSEVQNLLLDYIKRYNLRDPRRKSQVICDSRLQNLFGKSHVGHFEMLNLLDSHFHVKDDSQADNVQGSPFDTEANYLDADESTDHQAKTVKDKKRKMRKKGGSKGRQSNLDDFAAIDMHNINLIYLRRNLVEDLMEDSATLHDKVVGGFVRIRISSNQNQDLYRLVQVVGTSKVAEPYKVGKKTTDYLLEILNLNKTEVISIDIISNQDFSEDECKRLRQSIKCGLINRLTVGDIREKAIMLQEVRVKNGLEAEIERFNHLCDRASDMGRRKELRECVEKLQLLKSPEERQRRLEKIPEIHADPSMDPNCESEDEDETEVKKQDAHPRPRGSGFSRRGRETISPRKGSYGSGDKWSGTRNYSSLDRDLTRNLSGRGFSSRGENVVGSDERMNDIQRSSSRNIETQHLTNSEKPRAVSVSESFSKNSHSVAAPELPSSRVVQEISPAPLSQSAPLRNETEKIWHYKDPSGKIQGPFSVVQLRKWNKAGYFPADLRIWKTAETQEDSVLLTDALAGNFEKRNPPAQSIPYSIKALSTLEIPKQESLSSAINLPSPTRDQVSTPTPAKRRAFESRWSPTPPVQTAAQSVQASVSPSGPVQASKPEISMLVSPAGTSQIQPQTMMSVDNQRSQQVNPHTLPKPNSANTSMNHPGSATTVQSPLSVTGIQGWGNPLSQKQKAGNHQNSSSPSFGSGNPSGVFPAPSQSNFPQPDAWRLPAQNQPVVQAPTPPNPHWAAMNMANNQSTNPMQASANQNMAWGPMPVNPNMGWMRPVVQPGTNTNWVSAVPGSAQGNPNSGWVGPNQGQAQGGYSHTGWGMPGQAQTWAAPNQGSVPANPNPNGLNPQSYNRQNSNNDRFPNQRDGDPSGYGAGNGWNRQPSFGSGGSSGQRVCKFFRENGYCKKGASCDYLHN